MRHKWAHCAFQPRLPGNNSPCFIPQGLHSVTRVVVLPYHLPIYFLHPGLGLGKKWSGSQTNSGISLQPIFKRGETMRPVRPVSLIVCIVCILLFVKSILRCLMSSGKDESKQRNRMCCSSLCLKVMFDCRNSSNQSLAFRLKWRCYMCILIPFIPSTLPNQAKA